MTTQPGNPDSSRRAGADGRGGGQGRDTGQDTCRGTGPDLSAELQRWLIRSSARNMRRELTGQFRRTFGRAEPDNVWGAATTEPPPDLSGEAPECAWCPVCRAARRIRESGPGVGGHLAGAGDVVASAVQEALSAFEAVLSGRQRPGRPDGFPADLFPPDRFPEDRFPAAGAPAEGAGHEPDDRG
jgi:hypothetical protein